MNLKTFLKTGGQMLTRNAPKLLAGAGIAAGVMAVGFAIEATPSGKRNLGQIQDAIGINAKVAERLSGADFDGDTVMAIPMSDKVPIKSTRPLKDLAGFDPKTAYAVPEGNPNNVRLMKKEEKQREMGVISNLMGCCSSRRNFRQYVD